MEKSINDEGKIWGISYELQVSCWPSLVSECMFLLSQNDKQYNFILNHVMTGVHCTNSSSSSPARKYCIIWPILWISEEKPWYFFSYIL